MTDTKPDLDKLNKLDELMEGLTDAHGRLTGTRKCQEIASLWSKVSEIAGSLDYFWAELTNTKAPHPNRLSNKGDELIKAPRDNGIKMYRLDSVKRTLSFDGSDHSTETKKR